MRIPLPMLLLASALSAGCMSIPQFEKSTGITPKTVVDKIACELIDIRDKACRGFFQKAGISTPQKRPCFLGMTAEQASKPEGKKKLKAAAAKIKAAYGGQFPPNLWRWTAVAQLSLTVDEQATLAPAFTHPGVIAGVTSVFDWGLKHQTSAQRTYTETVTFIINKLHRCDPPPTTVSLSGDLGLAEIVGLAFGSIDRHDTGTYIGQPPPPKPAQPSPEQPTQNVTGTSPPVNPPSETAKVATTRRSDNPRQDPERTGKKESAFGTAIEFTVTRSINALGPTWTLASVKGPGKFFTAQVQNTHKVVISFARSETEAKATTVNLDLTSTLMRITNPQ